MWQPNQPVPQEFLDILNDEEESGNEDEDGFVEEEEEQLDIENMPVFVADDTGGLHMLGPGGDIPALDPAELDRDSDDDDDDEWMEMHQAMEAAISPLTSPSRSPVAAAAGPQAAVAGPQAAAAGPQAAAPGPQAAAAGPQAAAAGPQAAAAGPQAATASGSQASTTFGLPAFRIQVFGPERAAVRGRGAIRGRGRGRGRRRQPTRMGDRWMRGQPLQEVYVNDADLPPNIRAEIQRHLRMVNEREEEEVEEDREEEEDEVFNVNEQFEWRGMEGWNGERERFEEPTGPTEEFHNSYDAMRAIWTDDIMTHIADESNRYAQSTLIQRDRFARDWFETNMHEIWVMFGFWIMLGIIRMPTIKSCFTKLSLLKTDIFRLLFTETRYWNLNAAFHLVREANPNDPLNPMGPILEHLNQKFKQLYRLDQEICIDESLTLWKGPIGFKQYIKTKSARFGIKTYQLCESATGYLWSFFVYVGRATGSGSMPSSVSTVLRLIRPLLNFGHTLFMDNWFNSPTLARWLKRRRTDCVGTLRPSRKQVPVAVRNCPLQEGQFIARASDDVMVVALQDRKRVTCISTYHDVSQVQKQARPGHPAQQKLQLIDDYNQAMGGVDRLDQMLEAYLVERKQCLKWNKKLFKRLLNISIQNSRILVEKSTGSKIDSLAFRLALVQEIINRHLPHVPRVPNIRSSRHPTFPLRRLTERHFIRRIPITDEMRQSVVHRTNLGRRVCVWCTHNGRNRIRTVYECAECELPLCLETCFKEFHNTP